MRRPLRQNRIRLICACVLFSAVFLVVAGRAFRFLLEGYLAVRYGAEAKAILAHYYPWIGLALAVAILIFVVVQRRKMKAGPEEAAAAQVLES